MRFLFFFILCFGSGFSFHHFLIPTSLIGTWMHANSLAQFHVSQDAVQTFYKNGDVKMNINDVSIHDNSTICLHLNNLSISKIPSDMNFQSLMIALTIIKSISRHDLQINVQNESVIHYKSGNLNGNIVIKKIDSNK